MYLKKFRNFVQVKTKTKCRSVLLVSDVDEVEVDLSSVIYWLLCLIIVNNNHITICMFIKEMFVSTVVSRGDTML